VLVVVLQLFVELLSWASGLGGGVAITPVPGSLRNKLRVVKQHLQERRPLAGLPAADEISLRSLW
jgi:hypothetical protein